jgi:serine protease inhibitor
MKRSLLSRETYEFIANHPFIFFIHRKETDLTLFVGRFVKPAGGSVHHEEL